MAGIVIHDLVKVYGDSTKALDGLDLEVQPGELLVLVGPSGSGKTTLLRLVAGLDRPTAGSIRLDGRDLADVPPQRRDIALVFQSLALYGHLTVEQNLAFGLNAQTRGAWFRSLWRRGAANGEVRSQVDATARLLRIEQLLDRRPTELSGGEQQRVALGRAIVRRPRALLLDEPLSSLDLPTRRELRRELKSLQRRLGVPTIYVTHDQAEALAMGDRVAVLDRGRLIQVGTPDEIYDRPKTRIVAEFFGPQGMNLIEGQLKRDGGQSTFVGQGLTIRLTAEDSQRITEEQVLCGFRPEDARAHTPGSGDENGSGLANGCERFGDATYMQVRIAETSEATQLLTIKRDDAAHVPASSDSVSVIVDPRRLHWFDTGGKRL